MVALLSQPFFESYQDHGQNIFLAVSGGGDSMALLDLYRQAALRDQNLPRPNVVTIDHGLRQSFAPEAAVVEAYCATYNLPWFLKKWGGEKPKTGIMVAARLARYRLLAEAAAHLDASVILTGHTTDDQNETATMRSARGSVDNVPMEREVLFERRILICRPLLDVSRQELRIYLKENGILFADDPSNSDMRFERARVRAQISNSETEIPATRNQPRHQLIGRATAFLSKGVRRENNEVFISRPDIRDEDAEVLALRYFAAALGGFEYPAPPATGAKLFALLSEGQRSVSFTAQRCKFSRVEGGVKVVSDPRHAARPWLEPTVSPFETFCGADMMELATALAKIVGARAFLMP